MPSHMPVADMLVWTFGCGCSSHVFHAPASALPLAHVVLPHTGPNHRPNNPCALCQSAVMGTMAETGPDLVLVQIFLGNACHACFHPYAPLPIRSFDACCQDSNKCCAASLMLQCQMDARLLKPLASSARCTLPAIPRRYIMQLMEAFAIFLCSLGAMRLSSTVLNISVVHTCGCV